MRGRYHRAEAASAARAARSAHAPGSTQFHDGSLLEPHDALQLDVLSLSTLPPFGPEYCQQ
jgi:hypothetical protein